MNLGATNLKTNSDKFKGISGGEVPLGDWKSEFKQMIRILNSLEQTLI